MYITLTAADGHSFEAYTAGPKDASKALVVVQEIFGVNRHMRHVCEEFAKLGYAVICPALFDRVERKVELGYNGADVARGRELRGRITDKAVMADVTAAAQALPKAAKHGIVGYCWGGTVAWHGATRSRLFAAAVGWYGGGIAGSRDAVANCPVQLHFGEVDRSIPLTDVDAIREAQPGVEIHVYQGAGHGFGCEDRVDYRAGDANVAQARTLAFFDRYLR